jgi:hypothetical protein
MTPKEKAKELFDKYFLLSESAIDKNLGWVISALNKGLSKQCALIAVDELIKEELLWLQEVGGNESESEWIKVKQEIEKL